MPHRIPDTSPTMKAALFQALCATTLASAVPAIAEFQLFK
jgi:hypothetical protein